MATAKKLAVIDKTGKIPGLSFNVRYEKMDRAKKLEIDHIVEINSAMGKVEFAVRVKNVPIFDQPTEITVTAVAPEAPLPDATEVTCKKAWVDAAGTIYTPEQIKHYYQGQECVEKTKSNIFEIVEFQPIVNYNNNCVIDKYYEPWPDEDGFKKEADKDVARRKNIIGMRTLWEYLEKTQSIARGDFNVSTGGFQWTDGFMRAVSFGNKWGIELSIKKEEKVFQHLQEGLPAAVMAAITVPGPMRIKRV